MSEVDPEQIRPKPIPVRSAAPTPADGKSPGRSAGVPVREERARRRRGRPARPSKPTPVREAVESEPEQGAPEPEPDAAEVAFEAGGERWSARVTGRSGGDESPPLLLVGFWRVASDGATGEGSDLETLVPGRTLAALTETQLLEALGRAEPPPDPEKRPPFFKMAGDQRRR